MNLRKHVKAPERYEPELADAQYEERYMPKARKPLFRPPIVEYNPHLPPAAFPTLDKPKPETSETHQGTELGTLPLHQPPSNNVGAEQSSSSNLSASRNEARGQTESRMYSSPMRYDESATARHGSSMRVSNQTLPSYPGTMSAPGSFTEDMLQAIQHEMESSDEDSRPSSLKTSTLKRKSPTTRPDLSWKDLSPVLRLEVLHNLMDQDVGMEVASLHLGISPEEWQETIKWDDQCNGVSEREETKIQAMQQEIHQILLDGGPITKLTTTVYNRIFDRHLGSIVRTDRWHFNICTMKQLEIAHAFLSFKGLSRSLAGRWEELSSGDTYDHRNLPRRLPNLEISKAVGRLDSIIPQPKVSQMAQEPKSTALLASPAVHERGRSPVRRRYMTSSEETSPSVSKARARMMTSPVLPVLQSQRSTLKNTPIPYRPLAVESSAEGDTVMQDAPSSPSPVQILGNSGPLLLVKGSNDIVPCQLTANNPKPNLHPGQKVDQADDSPILVQPKGIYKGTARGTARAGPQPFGGEMVNSVAQNQPTGTGKILPQTGLSTKDSLETMERLKLLSMKHAAKIKPKPEKPVENSDQSSSRKPPIATSPKNVKNLSVSTSHLPSNIPSKNSRRASTGSVTHTSRATTAETPEQGTEDSLNTPMKSGSSTRSSRATQLPARYRDDLVETPTVTSRPRKSNLLKETSSQAQAPKAEVSSKKLSKGKKGAASKGAEGEDKTADHSKRLATSPPGSREPVAKRRARKQQAPMSTPSTLRSDTAQSSRAASVVSNMKAKKGKAKVTAARPKAGWKAPRKKLPRATL